MTDVMKMRVTIDGKEELRNIDRIEICRHTGITKKIPVLKRGEMMVSTITGIHIVRVSNGDEKET